MVITCPYVEVDPVGEEVGLPFQTCWVEGWDFICRFCILIRRISGGGAGGGGKDEQRILPTR